MDGIVVGEATEPLREWRPEFDPDKKSTWGTGGRARLLIADPGRGSPHWLFLAGSGAYKSMCAVVTLLFWRGPVVVLDPAGELAAMARLARERMGHHVFVLGPDFQLGTNAIGWVDATNRTAGAHIREIVDRLCDMPSPDSKRDPFWDGRSKKLIECFLGHILTDLPPDLRNLKTLAEYISAPIERVVVHLGVIADPTNGSASQNVRRLAVQFHKAHADTLNGIWQNANDHLAWLNDDAFADMVSRDDFDINDIVRRGDIDVFLAIPPDILTNTPALARVLLGGLMNAAYLARGRFRKRILFLLDEARSLGSLSIIRLCIQAGRKFGLSIMAIYQSTGQLIQVWGDAGKRDFLEAVDRVYAGISEVADAEEIEKSLGTRPVRLRSWSRSLGAGAFSFFGRGTVTDAEGGVPLLRKEQIMQLGTNLAIVFRRSSPPALIDRCIAWRRPEIMAQLDPNPYYKP